MCSDIRVQSAPLTCHGHTRPVVHLEYSDKQDDGTFLLLSSCKDGSPMYVLLCEAVSHRSLFFFFFCRLRDWVGDWVGTFLGHKGAVWSAKLNGGDAARAVTGSADFSA